MWTADFIDDMGAIMTKAVIFDFDYTLGDSTAGIARSINYALEKLGHKPRGIPEIRKTVGLSLKDTFTALTSETESAEKFAVLFREKADEVMTASTVLYPDTVTVLKSLREKDFKIGIVTTKYRYRIEQILAKFDAEALIDVIVGAEDVKAEKPAPEGLLAAILHLGADSVLYVGDSLVDAKTAENAGTDFAAVLTGATSAADFEVRECVCIAENLTVLADYVLEKDMSRVRTNPEKSL